ncbi:MAG TPA: mandelate racemase/muconate lactonizing enzyme family protein [Cyclobacteriaceae bacterium]|nr:mandelate racemase/muconate lactonizing enzyme family protein [Cyclobacteriaceae bacterium]
MKITNVEGLLMSYPMPRKIELPFWGGVRTILKRDAMLIKVTTDAGLVGYAPGPAFERAAEEIDTIIKNFLLGKDPLKWRSFNFSASPEIEKTYYAVEVALLDLVGKYEGCSISELMGGRVRSKIKLYGSAGMYMSPEKYAEEARAIQEMGFSAYKMRPGIGPDEDLRTVELMRQATGPDMGLMVDAHTWWRMGDKSYTPKMIHDLAKELKTHNPYWLEEPLPPEDHAAYAELKKKGYVTVATGEHEQELLGFEDLARRNACDFMQMDVCCQGGFEMGLKVFDLARDHKMKFAFHSWGTTLEVLAAAQLGACRDESVVEWLEYPCYSSTGRAGMYPFPLSDEILKEPLEIENGYLKLPDGNGLGVNINEEVIHQYTFIPGPWSFFHQTSPKQTIAVTGDHSIKWVQH